MSMVRTKTLAGALLLALAVAVGAAAQEREVVATEGKGRLERQNGQLVLYVKGSPYEMGFQHGRLLKDLVRAGVQAISDNQGELGKSKEYRAYKLMRPVMHMMLRRHIPERIKEEMRGVADGAGLDYDDVEAANLFPEAFHCSGIAVMGKATKNGSLYHVRILDYMTKAGLQDMSVVMMYDPDGYHRWANVGFAGFIGSVTGMNERQIGIGEMGGRGLFHWNGVPMAFLMRDALERADTLDEAVGIFRDASRTCEYYYVISDGKIPDARGLWTTPSDFEEMAPGGTYGFVTAERPRGNAADGKSFLKSPKLERGDHRILFKDKENKVEGFIAIQPEDCVVLSGYDRYQHFIDRLMPKYGQVDERALMEMIKRPVSMGSNLHCAIFRPDTLELWVAVAASDGSPACNQTYHRYQLEPRQPLTKTEQTSR
jgi:hypothetical protein